MNVSNGYLTLPHAIILPEMGIFIAYLKSSEFSFYNHWGFRDAYESSELIIKNDCGISLLGDHED